MAHLADFVAAGSIADRSRAALPQLDDRTCTNPAKSLILDGGRYRD